MTLPVPKNLTREEGSEPLSARRGAL